MDRNHNPEFTMLEFYWAYADYEDCMELVEDLIRRSAKKINALSINWGGMDIDLSKKFIRKPFIELVNEATGHTISELDQEQLK